MINPFKEINWQPKEDDLRKFAKSLMIGFPCICLFFACIQWWKTGHFPSGNGGILMVSGIGFQVGLVCYYIHGIARPLYYVWYALAACVGIVMANLLFAVLFYGLFTPIGLFMRLIGRDPLKLHWQKEAATTYWQDAEPSPPASQYFSQY